MTAKEYTVRQRSYLEEPGRRATEAYEQGARDFDQIKEIVLIDFGLVNTAEFIHRTAHWFPGEFDKLGDILHQRLVRQDYGETRAFQPTVNDLNDAFFWCLEALRRIDLALAAMIDDCDKGGDGGLARQIETLQAAVNAEYEKFLYAWNMYEEAGSPTSYDNWVLHLMNGETGPAWAREEDDD